MQKNIRNIFALALSVLFLAACASGPKIQSDYDPSVDFNQFKTFGFFTPMGIEGDNYSTLFGQQFRESISREMKSRGYVESGNAELIFNVSANLQEKTKVTTTTDPMMHGGYYGYRRGAYGAWGGYGYGTTTNVSQYTEGTVNVDMVDIVNKSMIWEGVAIGRLKKNQSNADTRVNIDKGVTTMFADFPGRAGN
jgi:hypothetical protein